MRKIIFATGNKNKVREINLMMRGSGAEIISLADAGIVSDAVENGASFAENALIKARAASEYTNDFVMADDSGLVIDGLGGEPGIYSARYMGEDTSYRIKNRNLIDRLGDMPLEKRTARFVCSIAVVLPDKIEKTYEGTIEGFIGYGEAGDGGFGYDPIFYIPAGDAISAMTGTGITLEDAQKDAAAMSEMAASVHALSPEMAGYVSTAQLPPDAKNLISHRGRALLKARMDLL